MRIIRRRINMPVSKAKIKANAKYTEKAYDKFLTYVPKGRKEELQAIAKAHNESLNGFVTTAIEERVQRL
jgi:predicted HicB family RNase H-like nuclease